MGDFQSDPSTLPPLVEDEYTLDSARVHGFVADVRARRERAASPESAGVTPTTS
jgi:hypothetical protein